MSCVSEPTFRNGLRSGGKLLYQSLFIFFWEHVCATISYMKFSWANVKGLDLIPQTTASSSIKSIACRVFSLYILSINAMQRCSNNLIWQNTIVVLILIRWFPNCNAVPECLKMTRHFSHYCKTKVERNSLFSNCRNATLLHLRSCWFFTL